MSESPFDDDISDIKDLDNTSLEWRERYAVKRQLWEENVLKRILIAGGKGQLARKLAQRHYERTNKFLVTFDEFKQECPEFPILLGFEKPMFQALEKTEKQLLNMRKAGKNVLVDLFYAHRNSLPAEYKECFQGVVFEWLHHGAVSKLIHNHSLVRLPYPWTRICISLPNTSENLYIEDLDCYLHTIGWSTNAK